MSIPCWYCGRKDGPRVREHQTPKSRGGGEGANLVPACNGCNVLKRDRTLEEWRQEISQRRGGSRVVFYGETTEIEAPDGYWRGERRPKRTQEQIEEEEFRDYEQRRRPHDLEHGRWKLFQAARGAATRIGLVSEVYGQIGFTLQLLRARWKLQNALSAAGFRAEVGPAE